MDKVEMGSITTTSRIRAGQMFASALLLAALIPLAGCRICADCDENAYAAYGGAWQRTTRDTGRVGSVFDPAGGLASKLVSRDDPENPDAQERARQEAFGTGPNDPDRTGGDDDKAPQKKYEDEESQDKDEDLRQRKLDDIEEKLEDELRKKKLDDINVRIIPGQPMPPVLR